MAIFDNNDNVLQRFLYADGRMPLATEQAGELFYFAYDQVGSLRAVTDVNDVVQKSVLYDSFGRVISDSNPELKVPFGFAGGLQNSETGLVRFGYRDYDPEMGRWTSKDPIGFSGDEECLYGYVAGDPVSWFDDEGESKKKGIHNANDPYYREFLDANGCRDKIEEIMNRAKEAFERGEIKKERMGNIRGWYKTAKDGRIYERAVVPFAFSTLEAGCQINPDLCEEFFGSPGQQEDSCTDECE